MSKRSTANMARRHRVDPGAPLLDLRGGAPVNLLAPSAAIAPRPHGHTAVMAARGPAPDALDYFPTPPWAARAGGELIKRLDPDARTCWEPACGEGHMALGLRDSFESVGLSDVHAYGAGAVFDFLDPGGFPAPGESPAWDWIVTNPPFVRGEDFARAAWPRARRGVALLLRLQFLEGTARHRLFQELPLFAVAPFAERVPMVKGRWDPEASSATAYAWFVWVKPEIEPTIPRAAGPLVLAIAPGARARLSRPGDLAHFGLQPAAPLLGNAP